MSLYTYYGDKINTDALYKAMEYAQDAQQIESGEFSDICMTFSGFMEG